MAFTYSVTTNCGKVRLIITDTDVYNVIFQDDEIDAFLSITKVNDESDIRLAAAMALDTMASSEAIIQKRIELLDLKTDGPAVAKSLREHAKELRRQVDEEFDFDWAEMNVDTFSQREIILKDWYRNG